MSAEFGKCVNDITYFYDCVTLHIFSRLTFALWRRWKYRESLFHFDSPTRQDDYGLEK